ncbi:unnamed protein product [Hanseniaspora opuntiae]
MNNGNSYSGNNKHNNQNGKSYRGYYSGNKPNDNTYKKTFVNNKYNQIPSYDQPRTTYPNSVNSSSRYQGRSGPGYEGSSHNSSSDAYYKKPYNKTNSYYSDSYQGNKKYNPRRYTGATVSTGHRNTVDALLDETKTSMFYDVFARYHQYYKKQLEKNILSEQEFIDKFEEVKKTYMGNTKLDEELKMKLGESQEKLKLDKLQYDISIMHYENIENIKGLEGKVSDDINLM